MSIDDMPDWPHAPIHRMSENGTYMVTAGTYMKRPYFNSNEKMSVLHDKLLGLAAEFDWRLQAWAVFANHYHFVAVSPSEAASLKKFLSKLHTLTAKRINEMDGTPGRKVWFQYWDSRITFQSSYLARLNYVHLNPVRHGLTANATDYPFCSASWFESAAPPAFRKTVERMKTEELAINDDF